MDDIELCTKREKVKGLDVTLEIHWLSGSGLNLCILKHKRVYVCVSIVLLLAGPASPCCMLALSPVPFPHFNSMQLKYGNGTGGRLAVFRRLIKGASV